MEQTSSHHTPPRKFAAFDIDGTLFRSGLYRELATEIMQRGIIDQRLVDNAQHKLTQWKKRNGKNSYDEYEQSLIDALDTSLPSVPTEVYDAAAEKIVTEQLDNVYTYTRAELARLSREGYFLIAISGSQQELVRPFAEKYGFDAWIGQRYVRENGHFTGEIIKTYTGKDVLLQSIVNEYNLSYTDSYAYGDSQGDQGMLRLAEHPVAFNPTVELLEIAEKQGWTIVVERKSVVYKLEKGSHGLFILAEAGKI